MAGSSTNSLKLLIGFPWSCATARHPERDLTRGLSTKQIINAMDGSQHQEIATSKWTLKINHKRAHEIKY